MASTSTNPILRKDSLKLLLYWADRYENSEIQWHLDFTNPDLIKHMKKITGDEFFAAKKFLLPMCGKTKDMLFLNLMGHEVYGVEMVEQAILDFSQENGFKWDHDQPERMFIHKEKDVPIIRVHQGNFLNCPMPHCPIEKYGPFDCVWDRCGFTSVRYEDRGAYINSMKRALNAHEYFDFKYLLQVVTYNKELYSGPPYSVDKDDMVKYFGDWTDFEEIERTKMDKNHPMRKITMDLGDNSEIAFYVLKPKILIL